jgi:hypothetical protein
MGEALFGGVARYPGVWNLDAGLHRIMYMYKAS